MSDPFPDMPADSAPKIEVLPPDHGPPEPDPGSRGAARIALIALCVLLPAVVALQQWPHLVPYLERRGLISPDADETTLAQTPSDPDEEPADLGPAPGNGQFEMASRLILKIADLVGDPASKSVFVGQLAPSATEPGDKVRLAICEAELIDSKSALDRLGDIDTEDLDLSVDISLLTRLFEDGSAALDADERDRIKDRYGWHGELALLHDGPTASPERAELLDGGWSIVAVFALFGAVFVAAAIAGCVLAVIAIIKVATGSIRPSFRPPSPGGSIYLETLAVFVVGFIAVQALGLVLSLVVPEGSMMTVSLALQWLLIGVIAWPIFRGVPRARIAHDLGWHNGKGVFREIGAGIAGYLAGIPVLIGAIFITLVILTVWSIITTEPGQESIAPSNPIVDILQNASVLDLVLIFSLATIWAPLVEETIFRGAVYRHLRSRLPWVAAGAGSAVLFGLMHGYFILLLLPVITLGVIFAAIREWRGSLIGPMIAHFLHNATLLTFIAIVFRLLL